MPTYGYQCTKCQHKFDVFQRMSDAPVAQCPECSGEVKRLLYPVGVVFKGTGWYINDSRKPEKSESAEKSGEGSDSKGEDIKSIVESTNTPTPEPAATTTSS